MSETATPQDCKMHNFQVFERAHVDICAVAESPLLLYIVYPKYRLGNTVGSLFTWSNASKYICHISAAQFSFVAGALASVKIPRVMSPSVTDGNGRRGYCVAVCCVKSTVGPTAARERNGSVKTAVKKVV